MKLCYNIAMRFLKSNITQTIVIVLGIGVGVSVQIFIGCLIQGLQKGLVDTTIGNSSHITITSTSKEETISDYSSLIKKIEQSDVRVTSVSPVSDHAAFLQVNNQSQSLLVRGFDLDRAIQIYRFDEYITEGALPKNNGEVVLGKSVKEEYGLTLGQEINLVTVDKRTVTCKVVGFFDLKVAQINNNWCVTNLETTEQIFVTGNTVTSIEIQVSNKDVFEADKVAGIISTYLNNSSLKFEQWKAQNEQLLSGLQGQSISSIMIQVFVIVSVVLGIASVLAITVMQKSRQIGILKAMGIKNRQASLIFLLQGLVLGILGAITGIVIGIGLLTAFSTFALNADGTPVVALYISASFIALSGVIAVSACVLASLIPAARSSKLSPIDIIRNN